MIQITITNKDGIVVSDIVLNSYGELANKVKELKPLLTSIDNGGDGVSVCIECGTEYPFGEDARADAGLKCSKCAYDNGD